MSNPSRFQYFAYKGHNCTIFYEWRGEKPAGLSDDMLLVYPFPFGSDEGMPIKKVFLEAVDVEQPLK